MVFCIVFGCGNKSEIAPGTYSSVPTVIQNQGDQCKVLSEERRLLWLKAVKRADLTEKKIKYERVCFRHFVNGGFKLV